MSADSSDPTTTIDSLLRAVARTPSVTTPQATLGVGTVIGEQLVLREELGRGGMGVVYRAHDQRLERDVAVKLMRADRWAHVPRAELVRLFEREARATARLQHPSIVTLHHAGEHEGVLYLVLELLRGRSLAARLTRPRPLASAIEMLRAIAGAIAHAHAEGVLHRDLKPHNIWVGDDDHVWVLDFGLAALQAEAVDARAGTPAYMAPEQRAGTDQDVRTDVWALGLLLYQMVTAHEPPALVAEADLSRAPWRDDLARLPPSVARVITGAVQWHAADRYPSVTAFIAALDRIDVEERAPHASRSRLPWLVAGGAVVASVVAIAAREPAPQPRVARAPIQFEIALPPLDYAAFPQSPPLAVSPDGRTIVFAGNVADDTSGHAMQLFRRDVDRADVTALADTGDAEGPAFSPDGKSLAFARDGELWRRPLDGGAATALASVHAGFRGVTWTDRDELVMAPSWFSPLVLVPATGGPPRPVTSLAAGEKTHRYPHALPGGKAVVFVVGDSRGEHFDDARVEWVELATGKRRVVTTGGAPRFVAPSTLLVPRNGELWAIPFDPATGAVTGTETRALPGMLTSPASGVGAFDVQGGTLVYMPGDPKLFATEVVRVDAAGVATTLAVPTRTTTSVRALSRDRLLLRIDAANATLRLQDLARETDTRLTWAWDADHAVVTPDDSALYFAVTRSNRAEIVRRRIDGTGTDEPIYTGRNPANLDLSRDGARLLFDERDAKTGAADIVYLELDHTPPRLVAYQHSAEHETQPALSPDGRWLAYTSSTDEHDQIFVQAFPIAGPRIQISAHGGRWPRWREHGRELVYRDRHAVISVSLEEQAGRLIAGKPRTLYHLADLDEPARRTFDLVGMTDLVTVRRPVTTARVDRMRVVVGWTAFFK
jgi:eukaryotic-like serine/threonine-protein kinase